MTGGRLDRAALALGLAALFSSLFWLSTGGPEPINLVHVRGVALVVILVLGAIAVLGALLHRRAIVIVAGAGFVVAAVLQLLQFGRETNWLGGDGSTLALMGGLGLGLLAVGLAAREASPRSERTRRDGSDRAT